MKFKVFFSTTRDDCREVEINSMEELKNLPERVKERAEWCFDAPFELVVNFEEMTIMVYDYYLE